MMTVEGSKDYGVVTVNIGVATITPFSVGERKQFNGRADRALYRAKQHGRNAVRD